MNELTVLFTLASVHLIALMSPGPDFALVVQNATKHGRQTGLYIALGLACSITLHGVFSLTGVSYLVQQTPTLFALLQLAGASYLSYLGYGALQSVWRTWKSKRETATSCESPQYNQVSALILNSRRHAFQRGFITNLINPKALVFFVSLVSSLIPATMSMSGKAGAIAIFFFLSLIWFAGLAWLLAAERLQKKIQSWSPIIDGLCGMVFLTLGVGIWLQVIGSLFALF